MGFRNFLEHFSAYHAVRRPCSTARMEWWELTSDPKKQVEDSIIRGAIGWLISAQTSLVLTWQIFRTKTERTAYGSTHDNKLSCVCNFKTLLTISLNDLVIWCCNSISKCSPLQKLNTYIWDSIKIQVFQVKQSK